MEPVATIIGALAVAAALATKDAYTGLKSMNVKNSEAGIIGNNAVVQEITFGERGGKSITTKSTKDTKNGK